jgi:hypothetical protein
MLVPSPSFPLRRQERRGTSFLRSVVRVMVYLLWFIVGVVGVSSGRISMPQLHSHTSGDLHGGISEFMPPFACRFFIWEACFLAALQIWRDLFLDGSLAFIVFHDDAGDRGEVDALERVSWSGGDASIVVPRFRRWDVVDLGSRKHGDVPRSTCHNDMCLVSCSGLVHRLIKLRWRWCFFGSGNGGGSSSPHVCA